MWPLYCVCWPKTRECFINWFMTYEIQWLCCIVCTYHCSIIYLSPGNQCMFTPSGCFRELMGLLLQLVFLSGKMRDCSVHRTHKLDFPCTVNAYQKFCFIMLFLQSQSKCCTNVHYSVLWYNFTQCWSLGPNSDTTPCRLAVWIRTTIGELSSWSTSYQGSQDQHQTSWFVLRHETIAVHFRLRHYNYWMATFLGLRG